MAVPAPANAPQTVRWWHWLWVAPLALFFRLWLATLRVRLAPGTREAESAAGGSAVIVLWHDRLFFAPVVSQRHLRRPVCALVSASKDGGWLTAFYNLMGIRCARGSSSSRGTEALMALARVAKAKVLLLGIRYHACWRLRSWDRFALPVPFSRVELSLEPAGGLPADESEACQAIGRRLDALSGD